ncbi:MAG: hypothetical protein ACK5MT_18995 [Actinomycetales bacterium]
MLSSITPLGERGRNARWPRTITFYIVGSVLGGMVVGGLAGLVGYLVASAAAALGAPPMPLWVQLVIVCLAAAAGALLDTDRLRRRLPTIHRQVNEDWLDLYRPWVYGGGFGFQLGLGVVTIVTTAAVYLLLLIIVLIASWPAGLVLGGIFGLARALPVLAVREVNTPIRLTATFESLAAAEPRARRTAIAGQAVVAAAAGLYLTLYTVQTVAA